MSGYGSFLLLALLVVDLYMVSTHRLDACIRAGAIQGAVLAALVLVLGTAGPACSRTDLIHLGVVSAGTLLVKSWLIPRLLFRALRELGSHREFEPFISLHLSQFLNGALCGAAFWIASALPWPGARAHTLGLGVGLATLLIGITMTINRRKTISQVMGFLVVESGLLVIGWTLIGRPSLVLELGALLDVFVAVMVMGALATNLDAAEPEDDPRHLEHLP